MIKITTPYNVVISGSPNASRRADSRITNYNGLFFSTWIFGLAHAAKMPMRD